MNWFVKNKKKIIIGVVAAGILAFAFWYGGDAPGLKGWSINDKQGSDVHSEQTSASVDEHKNESDLKKTDEKNMADKETDPKKNEVNENNKSNEEQKRDSSSFDSGASDKTSGNKNSVDETKKQEESSSDNKKDDGPKQEIDPNTGKDKYQTDPVPEGKPVPVEPQEQEAEDEIYYCTFSISCASILNNMEYLNPEKEQCVPADGWILYPQTVAFYAGQNVYDVLAQICMENGIHMEASFTPMYNSVYIEGINNLYEFDCGQMSGWMYKVNEWFPNYGASRYVLQNGDVCCWVYTCDLGNDVGGGYAMGY